MQPAAIYILGKYRIERLDHPRLRYFLLQRFGATGGETQGEQHALVQRLRRMDQGLAIKDSAEFRCYCKT